MKILLLTDWEYPCDHRFLKNVFSENLTERGHELIWVMRPPEDSETTQIYQWNGNPVIVPPTKVYDPKRSLIRHITRTTRANPLIPYLNEYEFDLIHVRNDLSMGLLALQLSKRENVPFVHQISHLKAESLVQLTKEGHEGYSTLVKGVLGKHLRRYIANRAGIVLPISLTMEEYLKKQEYTTPMIPLLTGANTNIDLSEVEEQNFREQFVEDRSPLLLYMGTMTPTRNLEFLFDVLSEVRHEVDATLLMVGGRSEENRKRLRRIAVETGVADNVIFTGWISDSELLYSAIKCADIGLCPLPPNDILQTNAPIKVLEYLSMETPVVVSDTPDQRAVVNSSKAGLVVEYDSKAFAEAICSLLRKEEPSELGTRGRKYVQDERSFEKLTDTVLEIYNQVLHS